MIFKNAIIVLLCSFTLIPLTISAQDITKYNEIYNSLKNKSSEVLMTWGDSCYATKSLDSALVCFSIVSGRYIPNQMNKESKHQCAHAYNRCGAIYFFYNSYTKALGLFLKSLEVCEESAYMDYTPRVYNNIGNVYAAFRDYKNANNYYEKGYQICLDKEDHEVKNTILKNLIGTNCFLKNYEQAKVYLNEFKQLEDHTGAVFNYYLSISNGSIDLRRNKYESALQWYKNAIQYADSCDVPSKYKYVAISNIAQTYSFLNENDSAVFYWKKIEKIADIDSYLDLISECYQNLSEIYHRKGNEKASLMYKRKFLSLGDSIFNIREFGQIKDMQLIYEMERIEKEIFKLTDEQRLKDEQIKLQQQILVIIAGALVAILVLLLIGYFQNKRLREANKELFNKNVEIVKSESSEKKKYGQYEKKLRDAEQIITGLKSKLPDFPVEEEVESSSFVIDDLLKLSDENRSKYQSSVLNDEEKLRLRDAVQQVMEDSLEYCSPNFNLERLALLVDSKSKYVSQVINEIYGKNFNVFVNEYRIKEARRRLMDTSIFENYTIATISTSVGFKSTANFNLIFKKVTGITPSIYQKMLKESHNIPF